ncbi:ATP-binding cassette domain-containing protein [Buchnera aphidicola]|uniref:ATP-binding cassette domain-containing protein n=1 Tax=Buchnera aphidicola TaxID=9 RepID=UPI003CE46220
MFLIHMKNAYLSFSNIEILKNSTLSINKHERVCLIGKNGTGKSTILKIINKQQDLDCGKIIYKKNIKISYLTQDNPTNLNISLYDFMHSGCTDNILDNKNNIDNKIKIEQFIKLMKLNKYSLLNNLSGGLLRQAALIHTFVGEPDILLLDEPTNHLDMRTIQWLENFLKKFSGSILFVSHNRNFIDNISTRIIDLDRGKLVSWPGNYKNFIKLKNESHHIEMIQKKLFDKRLKQEEKWIRKNLKARSTRNEGRVQNLKILREECNNYRKIEILNDITVNESKKYLGKIVFKLENVKYLVNNKIIIQKFSSIIERGDKVGLIGDNGCGKSTLIKILLGENQPNTGKIYIRNQLKISYFDQNRSTLNQNKSIIDNISNGQEYFSVNGKEQHIISYLKNFLFQPNQLTSLVKTLSGGECSRLLLAQLFLQPSNVLILDEPTNDLDLETIQLIEKIIINYTGTVFIVSHDKDFINNTVNKCWLFKKYGFIETYLGNYESVKKTNNSSIMQSKKQHISQKNINKKTTNQFLQELNQTLRIIEEIELKIKNLQQVINEPNFFKKQLQEKLPILNMLSTEEQKLKKYMINWEKLEQKCVTNK